jgi:hypothetical protein
VRILRTVVFVVASSLASRGAPAQGPLAPADTGGRPHAIEYSSLYYTRLKIHQIGAIVMLPLLAGEYALGDNLLRVPTPPTWVKPTHGAVAGTLAVVAGVNTASGLWNLWDSRHDTNGRFRRYLHVGIMAASDVGYALAGATADGAHQSLAGARRHRNIAVGAIGLDVVGTVMMWVWKD